MALLFAYVSRRIHLGFFTAPLGWLDVGFLLLAIILFVGSRDTLRKYYSRVNQVLGVVAERSSVATSNRIGWNPKDGLHDYGRQRSSQNRSILSPGR